MNINFIALGTDFYIKNSMINTFFTLNIKSFVPRFHKMRYNFMNNDVDVAFLFWKDS